MSNQLLYVTAVYCYDFWTDRLTFACKCPNKDVSEQFCHRANFFYNDLLLPLAPVVFFNSFELSRRDASAIAPSGVGEFHANCRGD